MKLSANEEYGLRCMVRLAYAGEGSGLTIPEISVAEGVSPAYAAKILRVLRKGGFVKAARGKDGGYTLARPAEEIVIGDVVNLLGGRLFETDFDLSGAARFVLGPNARSLTPEQNQEFLTLFREYLAQAYSTRLGEYGGAPFHVTGSRPSGEETVVSSEVRRSGNPVRIDWHVADRDGRMKITDVYVDGVSMKVTHRQEFASIVQRNGGRPESLLAALRQQLNVQVTPARSGPSAGQMPAAPAMRSGSSSEPMTAPPPAMRSGSSSEPMPAPQEMPPPQAPAPAER